jgi:hypothetical protein
MEATRSSETSVFNKATRRHIREDGIPHSHRHWNLKSYENIFLVYFLLFPGFIASFVCESLLLNLNACRNLNGYRH